MKRRISVIYKSSISDADRYYVGRILFGTILFLFISLFCISFPRLLYAQPLIGAKNIALGGGGTAYLSGIEANFYNPANLMIFDRKGTFHVNLGNSAVSFEPVLSESNIGDQARNFSNILSVHRRDRQQITDTERRALIEENFPDNTLLSQHQTRAELLWGGIQWQKESISLSLVARSRFGSRIEAGRGWYSTRFIEEGDRQVRDISLIRQSQTLHELSLGIAHEFTFISGRIPSLSKLYIGIAPKLVISGDYSNTSFNARYIRREGQVQTQFARQFDFRSTGNYTGTVTDYRNGVPLTQSVNQNLGNSFFSDFTGYGFGIDFGLTYQIPLGNNTMISDSENGRRPVKKSFRIAFSVTDLGYINYSTRPFRLNTASDTLLIESETVLDTKFIGSAGQLLSLFDNADALPNPFLTASETSGESFTELLPTSVNTGVLLDLNRIKASGDITLALNDTAFRSTSFTSHLGLEVRPHPKVPVRLGAQLAAGLPAHLGFGTGIETRYWDFMISSQMLIKSGTFITDLAGGALAAFQFHF